MESRWEIRPTNRGVSTGKKRIRVTGTDCVAGGRRNHFNHGGPLVQGIFVSSRGTQRRYVRAGHKKERPWNMMHDTRTCIVSVGCWESPALTGGKGARSRPRTMGAWVSNDCSNDTGAPRIGAYVQTQHGVSRKAAKQFSRLRVHITAHASSFLFFSHAFSLPRFLFFFFFFSWTIQWYTYAHGWRNLPGKERYDGYQGIFSKVFLLLLVEVSGCRPRLWWDVIPTFHFARQGIDHRLWMLTELHSTAVSRW